MLTKKDLERIGVEVATVINDNVLPQIETLRTDVKALQTTVATLPTKDFVEERFNKTDGKIATLTNTLERKGVITEEEKRLIHS